jgi:hypothetical protein
MIKLIPSQQELWNEPLVAQVKIARAGLKGKDLSDLVQRSGHALAQEVQKMAFAHGEVPIHLIAMSAHEATGWNRNFDTWYASDLKKDHPTFEKYARFFRDHQNGPTDPYYGLVKRAWYNPDLLRVELIVALNGDRHMAEKTGGHVADRELEKLASGKDIPVSMSTKLAFDQCSGCQHRAPNRDTYCDGPMCKYGGLKKNIGRAFEDGHVLHTSNPNNRFFDISHVYRPADRTAYVLGKVGHLMPGFPDFSGPEQAGSPGKSPFLSAQALLAG